MTMRDDYDDSRSDFEEFYKELDPHAQEFPDSFFKYNHIKQCYSDHDVEIAYQLWLKAHQCGYDAGHADGIKVSV